MNIFHVAGIIAAGSVLILLILLAACAAGKREDEAAAELADAQCRTDLGEAVFHEQLNMTGAERDHG